MKHRFVYGLEHSDGARTVYRFAFAKDRDEWASQDPEGRRPLAGADNLVLWAKRNVGPAGWPVKIKGV